MPEELDVVEEINWSNFEKLRKEDEGVETRPMRRILWEILFVNQSAARLKHLLIAEKITIVNATKLRVEKIIQECKTTPMATNTTKINIFHDILINQIQSKQYINDMGQGDKLAQMDAKMNLEAIIGGNPTKMGQANESYKATSDKVKVRKGMGHERHVKKQLMWKKDFIM